MKQRFNKLLATALAATLCVPALPAMPARAAASGNDAAIVWTDPESISVTQISEDERFINFNEGWKFYLGDSSTAHNVDFIDSSWEDINLPHDFSITQNFTSSGGEAESGFLPGGTGWYRKKFTLPESFASKSVVLNFDGVYKDTDVYVNGTKIGEHHYGYSPFAFDISDYLVCDDATENVIAVRADHQLPSSRWYSGSGIYRDVTLIATNPVHVDLNGTFVTTPNLEESNGSVGTANIAVDVKNSGDAAANVTVKNTVFKKGSETPAAFADDMTATIAAGETKTVTATASVSNPDLWSIDDPNLYTVKTEIVQNGTTIDTYETEFGYKWYKFVDNTGFQLNGENVKIKGVCMHNDQGALGSAMYYDAVYRQMSIMKEMGANTIRITHNPGSENLVDICNKLGLLVIEEFFDGWAWPKNGNSNDFSAHFEKNMTDDNQVIGGSPSMKWAEFTLKSVVKRDRNDASIILWSLCNEVDEGSGGGPWNDLADNVIRWTKEADTTHPVTSGSNRRFLSAENDTSVRVVNQKVFEAGGIPGFNYGDKYNPRQAGQSMEEIHERYPVFLWSETASAVTSRGIYTSQTSQGNADGKYHLTSYDTSAVGWGKTAHASMYHTLTTDWLAGECVWTGFDYIGEPSPWNNPYSGDGGRGAIPNSSYFGIVETTGFPKDNYYLYRSQWNQKENTLHLVTAWDSDNQMITAGKTPVWVYSNAPVVKLYLNDELIGTATRKDLSQTTTEAGHVHYEYTTASNNANICEAVSVSPTDGDNEAGWAHEGSLYSVFNVAFTAGTISAKAFDADGTTEITGCQGTNSISTPGAAAKLVIPEDYPQSIDADGKSLAYITVDVKDANNNFKTTATNQINFSLTGNGEIVGVDNGDQATVDKYQQKSVLKSSTSAQINAYAGKALVIVRSTKDGGNFTLTASSDGLTSDSATIQTKAIGDTAKDYVKSYTMRRHCYLPIGTAKSNIQLPKTVEASLADGTTKTLNIAWDNYDAAILKTKGNHKIAGTITNNKKTINVSVLLHVYKEIVGVQNYSLCTAPNMLPSLPTVSMAYDADGDKFEEYSVNWDMTGITADKFANVNEIITINGSASIFGKNYSTTASVRVADPNITYKNVALDRDSLTDNGLENGSKTDNGKKDYDDNLLSLTDKNRADNAGSDHWSDYGHRTGGAQDNLQIAMDWATATLTDRIDIYYSKTGDTANAINDTPPSAGVIIEYATASNYNPETEMLEAAKWNKVEYATPTVISQSDTSIIALRYQLNTQISPQALRFTFSHPAQRFIALTEIEVMYPNYSYDLNSDAALTGVKLGDKTIEFKEGQTEYAIEASSIETDDLTFENADNASVTLLPLGKGKVQIISVSEDGQQTKTYTLQTKATEAVQEALKDFQELSPSTFSPSSYNALKALVDEIEQNMSTYTESELQTKLNELNAKKDKLATTATYNSLLTECGNLKQASYSDASWNVLKTLVDDIKKNMDKYSESDLRAKLTELTTKKSNLATAVTYNSLRNKLTAYGNLKQADYTATSWKTLNDLITLINKNLDTYSESELQAQITKLESTKKALVPVSKDETPKDETTFKNVQYKILNAKAKTATALKLAKANATAVTIQATVKIGNDSYKVTEIAPNFAKASKLKSVVIGKNVKAIGQKAFNGCKKLNKVTFKGTSVKKIGSKAFKNTNSKITVKVPNKVKKAAFKKKLTKAGMSKRLKI